jgi:hypothetical protein
VHEDRRPAFGRQTEHLDHFQPGGAWCVSDPHSDAKRTSVDLAIEDLLHACDLIGLRWIVGGGPGGRHGGARRRAD